METFRTFSGTVYRREGQAMVGVRKRIEGEEEHRDDKHM